MFKLMQIGIAVAVLLLSGCGGGSSDSNPPDGGEPPVSNKLETVLSGDYTVEYIRQDGSAQIAGTTAGVYWRADTSADWQLRSPTTTAVTGIIVLSEGHYLMATEPTSGDASEPYLLFRSQDSGATWEPITHNFGREFNTRIFNLAYDHRTDQVYAVGNASLAVASPAAENWQLLTGSWDGFAAGLHLLLIDDVNQSVWFGGQGPVENGYFGRYDQTTQNITEWHDLLPRPSTYVDGLIHPLDTSTVILGGEGGIVLSNDYGETWSTPMGDVDYRFYRDIVSTDAGILYTAGYDKLSAEQPLIIECSIDNGQTWLKHDFSHETSRGGVRSLMLVSDGDRELLYLGLRDNGIKAIALNDLDC
ncbi:hypothetical protein [Pseudidiomarina sp.]|uniref:hypothetical protein n=1 Tax=Pseudidiomarina sp. TaxID=2081707 RepID=UPI003A96A25A